MPSMSVQRNLDRSQGGKTDDGEMVRCPHCSQHFFSGGEVEKEAHGFEADYDEEKDFADKVDEYSARHHYRSAEGGKYVGFAEGGRVPPRRPRSSEQYSNQDDKGAEARSLSRDREGDAMSEFARENYDAQSERGELAEKRQEYAHGGRVDGSGKVDGIHRHPSECSHLSSGGVCRHMAGRSRGDDNEGDDHVRNFAHGGGVDSFEGYLAKRHAARGMRNRKDG